MGVASGWYQMLVASSEPPSLRSLGAYSALCEEHGADFLILSPIGLVGCQRKSVSDLVASIQGPNGDRLGREVAQLQSLEVAILIVEGDWAWGSKASTKRGCESMTRARYRSLVMGVQYLEGIHVVETTGLRDTRETLIQLEEWFQNPHARSLRGRPKPKAFNGVRDRAIFTMQAIPGVSVKSAGAAWDHFGKLPVSPTCSQEELEQVEGWGPKRARAFMETFGG